MERDGVLQPVRDERGWNVFELAQVLQLQAQRVHGDASQHEGDGRYLKPGGQSASRPSR